MSDSNIFLAHLKDGRVQSVKEHCENVAGYASEEAKNIGLSDTMRLTGLLHDAGKITHAFRDYISKAAEDPAYHQKINHSSAGGRFLYDCIGAMNGMDTLVSQLIAYAVVSHHGLSDLVDISGNDCFDTRIYPEKENFYQEVLDNLDFLDKTKVRELFEKSISEIDAVCKKIRNVVEQMQSNPAAGNFMLGGLQRLLLSFLVDADWRDTSEFMDHTKYERLSTDELSMKWEQYQSDLDKKLSEFPQDSPLSVLRTEMSDLCYSFARHGNGIYKLEIPTGGGKTLASMRYALELAKKEKKKHIYYIAPFLSILEQNAREFRNIFSDDKYVLEYHSNVIVSEDNEKGSRLSDDWSEPVILTTMVQFLNTMFDGNMKSVRRFHQLTDAIIIIDEAQSIPVKCLCMFTTMTNFLSQCCNTTFIICTATQPLFEELDYQLLYSEPGEMIADIKKYYEGFKRTQIINCIDKSMDTPSLADMTLTSMKRNILVILNTKAAVGALYDEICRRLDEDIEVYQLTTYMCAAHRLDTIEEIKRSLKQSNKRLICISTQLVEAGVDISFETVIRSLAGLDSVAQAAGRCNRNAEQAMGNVYIVDYKDENVSRLKDIRLAQEATRLVMNRMNGDLFSQEAMELYYREYFYKRKSEMLYDVEEINDTLYNLLSNNKKRIPDTYAHPLAQSFKKAGEYFRVIDEGDTVGMIVPYGKAKDYLSQLEQAYSLKEIKDILKKLQRYTVNVYKTDTKLKTLLARKAIDKAVSENVYILNEAYYDKNGLNDKLELLAF